MIVVLDDCNGSVLGSMKQTLFNRGSLKSRRIDERAFKRFKPGFCKKNYSRPLRISLFRLLNWRQIDFCITKSLNSLSKSFKRRPSLIQKQQNEVIPSNKRLFDKKPPHRDSKVNILTRKMLTIRHKKIFIVIVIVMIIVIMYFKLYYCHYFNFYLNS